MTIFTIWFQDFPNNMFIFLAAASVAAAFVVIFLKSALVAEGGRHAWARRLTGPNSRLLFGVLVIAWCLVFGITLQIVPEAGASSPYGGIALIGMFTGFFIMMGLIWSVVGE